LFCLVSPCKRAGKGSIDLASIPVVREFRDVFPKRVAWITSHGEIKVSIETIPGIPFITQSPYRMTPMELVELKV